MFSDPFLGASPSHAEREQFDRDGYVLLPSVLEHESARCIAAALDEAFRGRFETETYPDSLGWQAGTSHEDIPRQMVNAWKCSLTVSRLVLAAPIAQMACAFMGWSAARLAADSVWMKPPNWREGGYHRDEMDLFAPADLVTCWVALSDMTATNGSLRYAAGSHRWDSVAADDEGVNIGDRPEHSVRAIAARLGVDADLRTIVAPIGSLSIHHGRTWHGSGANQTPEWRNAIGIHLIRADARFTSRRGGHVLGRYRIKGEDRLDENFFPIVWGAQGERSAFLDQYCRTGERG